MWISISGVLSNFFSDNGGEFSNEDYMELCEAINITIKKTAAQAPFSNALCGHHNVVLEEMFLKTRAEAKCDFITALQWAVNAKNYLSIVHGFSTFQLLFGRNPRLPTVLTDKLPALQNVSGSGQVLTNLKAMQEARKAFIVASESSEKIRKALRHNAFIVASESSEKIRKALRHNISSSGGAKFFSGDSVYCKRNDSKRWRG